MIQHFERKPLLVCIACPLLSYVTLFVAEVGSVSRGGEWISWGRNHWAGRETRVRADHHHHRQHQQPCRLQPGGCDREATERKGTTQKLWPEWWRIFMLYLITLHWSKLCVFSPQMSVSLTQSILLILSLLLTGCLPLRRRFYVTQRSWRVRCGVCRWNMIRWLSTRLSSCKSEKMFLW